MFNHTAEKETAVRTTKRGRPPAPAEDVEAAVRNHHPHLRLDRSTYEARCRPATWRCILHHREFRGTPSDLARSHAVGCPDCTQERAKEKRRQKRGEPNLEKHLDVIRERFGEEYALLYRLNCNGETWEDIGAELATSYRTIYIRLDRIKAFLAEADRESDQT